MGNGVARTLKIRNKLGLHARAAVKFVQLASKFKCEIKVAKDDQEANGKSIMGLLTLVAAFGMEIVVSASAGIASAGSDRNGIGSRPSACAASATSPASGVRMKRQISVTIVTVNTAGAKNTPRNSPDARVRVFNASANASAIAVSGGTITSTR